MIQRRLRVLLTADAVGGVWPYVIELGHALCAQHIEPIVAVLGPPPSPAQLAGAAGLRVIATGLPLDWLCAAAAPVIAAGEAIARLARAEDADCVQLNMPTLAAQAPFDVPVIAVTHGCVATWWAVAHAAPLAADYVWHRELMGQGLRAADIVVAPTAAYGAIVARHYDLHDAPVTVHNGRRSPQGGSLLAPRDYAFTAGRLWDRVKNAEGLDRIAGRLAVPFYAAGPLAGPHGECVVLDALQLLGTLDDRAIAARLAQRPVFVSAARFEPFGLAVLEAAAAGCALVLSDIAPFRELWDGSALFVPCDDVSGFAHAIARIIADPAHRFALGSAARERAARYTPAATASAMARIYRRLVAQRRVPTGAAA